MHAFVSVRDGRGTTEVDYVFVVFFEELDDADVVFECDNVGFGEGFEVGHV